MIIINRGMSLSGAGGESINDMTAPRASDENINDNSPSWYLMRVSRRTGEEIPGPIDPDELLIHAHRDRHPLEVTAQYLASRAIQLTGNEELARQGLRLINTLGTHLAQPVGAVVGGPEVERQANRRRGDNGRDYADQAPCELSLSGQEVMGRVEFLRHGRFLVMDGYGR